MGIKERQERDREAVRRSILDAARELFVTEGYQNVSIRKIAERIEYSPASIYSYFPSKDDIFFALAEEGFRLMAAGMRAAATEHPEDAIGRLRACGLAYIAFARAHPEHFRVMFGPYVANRARYPGLRDAASESFGLLEARIADGQKAGFIAEADIRALAIATWSTTHGFASLLVNGQMDERGGGTDPAELASRVTAVLFFGIGKR